MFWLICLKGEEADGNFCTPRVPWMVYHCQSEDNKAIWLNVLLWWNSFVLCAFEKMTALFIPKELNTGRSAWQCFKHYQEALNPRMVRKEWTPQEDNALINAVALYGDSKVRGITITIWNQSLAFHTPRHAHALDPELGECRWGSSWTQVYMYHDRIARHWLQHSSFGLCSYVWTQITAVPLALSSVRCDILKAA